MTTYLRLSSDQTQFPSLTDPLVHNENGNTPLSRESQLRNHGEPEFPRGRHKQRRRSRDWSLVERQGPRKTLLGCLADRQRDPGAGCHLSPAWIGFSWTKRLSLCPFPSPFDVWNALTSTWRRLRRV
jgi:hypothetical protein